MFSLKEEGYWNKNIEKEKRDSSLSIFIPYKGLPEGFVKQQPEEEIPQSEKTGVFRKIFEKIFGEGEKNVDQLAKSDIYYNDKYPDLVLYYETSTLPDEIFSLIGGSIAKVRDIRIGPKKELIKDISGKDYLEHGAPISFVMVYDIQGKPKDKEKWVVKRKWMKKAIDYVSGNYQPEDNVEQQLLDLIIQLGFEDICKKQEKYKVEERNLN